MMNMDKHYAGEGALQDRAATYDPRVNAYAGGYKTGPVHVGKHHSAFDQVDQLQRQAMTLARRVNELVCRIIGPVPEGGDTQSTQRPVSGMLDAIDDTCREPNRQMARALDALDRLEAALPQQ